MKKGMLNRVRQLYNDGGNIIQFLKGDMELNSTEDIMISYDFQAGSYTERYKNNPKVTNDLCNEFIKYIRQLYGIGSIFEAGVGEANKLATLMNLWDDASIQWGGCDLSWSRIKAAQNFTKEICGFIPKLFVGDMACLPFQDSSIDLVYTMYALEPNGGREAELIQELYRVTRKYLVLLEPAYEIADDKQKEWMNNHGYVKGLMDHIKGMGLKVLDHKPFLINENTMNPTAIIIVEKNVDVSGEKDISYSCPITRTLMKEIGNVFYSSESMLAYPIVNEVPMLTEENAIVATKLEEYC